MNTFADLNYPVRARIDLAALRANTAELKRRAGQAQVMAVVKANAYGHGLVPCARAALAGGASWLGAAQISEGLRLRTGLAGSADGDGLDQTESTPTRGECPDGRVVAPGRVPIFSWLYTPGAPFGQALTEHLDLGVSAPWALTEIAAAARTTGMVARLHLKIDTGLGRSGSPAADWENLVDQSLHLEAEGLVKVVGVWSHLAHADSPTHPTVRAQQDVFAWAVAAAESRGAHLEVRHLANSAALLSDTAVTWDLVRPGLALYGLSPIPDVASPSQFGLRPVMTLESQLALVKRVPPGQGVSYGHTYTTDGPTCLGLVPAGYSDGVPRQVSNTAPVLVGGRRLRVAGRICMDQFVVDLGPDADGAAGDPVVLFGSGEGGGPTAQDWAEAAGTISYEIVTRIPAHIPRIYQS